MRVGNPLPDNGDNIPQILPVRAQNIGVVNLNINQDEDDIPQILPVRAQNIGVINLNITGIYIHCLRFPLVDTYYLYFEKLKKLNIW